MRIAFAGNPNSGKTTMYNALTGRNEKVGALVTTGSVGAGFLPGLIVVAAIVAVIVTLIKKPNRSLATEYALKK